MDKRRSTSFAIMIASLGPVSLVLQQQAALRFSKTPYHAPRANAICERFLLRVRRECLDHVLVLHEKQLHRVLRAYVEYFNRARPHQGIRQQVPEREVTYVPSAQPDEGIISVPV